MVDCSVIGFGFFLENGIPIIPYYDSKEDVELKLLSFYLLSISSNNDLRIALKRDIELSYYFQKARETNNSIVNNLKRASTNVSPEIPKHEKRKRESKTYKFSNYIHIYKRNSHSFEGKENHKKGLTGKGSKKKRKGEKEEDNKYISPKKERESLFKKKKRKYTANTQRRNFLYRSPKISSTEKWKKAESKKNFDKNK